MAQYTRWGSRFATKIGTQWPANSGSAAFSGVIDDVVAAGGGVPNLALCWSHRLYTAYTGSLARIRRAGDNVEADIPYDTATNRLNTAAVATHCGANHGYLKTWYDQSGNVRDQTNATLAEQPKIYDGTTGIVLAGALPVMQIVGGPNQDAPGNILSRGDASGFSGTPSVTGFVAARCDEDGARVFDRILTCIGAGFGTGDTFDTGYSDTANDLGSALSNSGFAAGVSYRRFTPASSIATFHYTVSRHTGGSQFINTTTKRQNGTALSQSAVDGPVVTFTPVGASTVTGASHTAGYRSFHGVLAGRIDWNSEITGAALTALETFGASLNTLAGS